MTSEPIEAGFLHRPQAPSSHALVLTHGAGSNCNAPLLIAVAEAFASSGILVYRYNLPFRVKRPRGSPSPSTAAADREGIREAIRVVRPLASGCILAGGHSYGGRQTSMVAAEAPDLVDGLLLQSYPLHPPGKPDQLRTAHLHDLRAPTLFVHGSKDPFGSEQEIRAAIALIPARCELSLIEGAGHDLGRNHKAVADEIVRRANGLLLPAV